MPSLTISAAARVCGCDRRTLQRAVQAGRLTLDAQHCLSREALVAAGYLDPTTPQVMPHITPHIEPQDTPQELVMVTALLAHLEQLTTTVAALHAEVVLLREDLRQAPQRRRRITQQDTPHSMPQDTAPMPHHDALVPQEPPQGDAPVAEAPQADAAPVPQHDALLPQETPHVTPQEPATAERAPGPLLPHVLAIAEIAAQYDKLSLAELSQLLYDRNIYRAKDRKAGDEKPVNRGTLGRWLEQARQAGVL